ncbi:cold shock domain-containing protein [Bradyrhizobium sp. B097]|uniref:cold-shock protein n=1 Tax=Bradyrhizobium sp. B097 TaxID=3140244 RepID=UPI003182FAAD
MNQGIIKHVNPDAGFGFIRQDSGGDLFFHFRQMLSTGTPQVDQRVSFDVGASRDGKRRAERVRIL